jgi:hypothetical protein
VNKLVRFIQNYLIVGLPFVIACMVWSSFLPEEQFLPEAPLFLKILWNTLSFNLMAWFAVLILFLTFMVVAPNIREKTLWRLANLKERDEREQAITGKASRVSYISTLSLTLFFLFFSMFSLKISSLPKGDGWPHESRQVSIGLHFSFLNQAKEDIAVHKAPIEEKVIFDSKKINLSSSAILLILLCWQLSAFNITARKALRGNA